MTRISRIAKCAAIGLTLVFWSIQAQATLITYSINLSGSTTGTGKFVWDTSDNSFRALRVFLDPCCGFPFPGGFNDPVASGGPGSFNGSGFTSQVTLLYAPFFDVRLETDGTWRDAAGGRLSGTYSVAVPEPGSLVLVGLGLIGLALRRRLAR